MPFKLILFVHLLGIGPKRAIDLIKQHKSIEEIVKHIDIKVSITSRIISR